MAHDRWAQRPSVVGFIAPPKGNLFHRFNIEWSMALHKRSSNDIWVPITGQRQQGGGGLGAPGRHKLHNHSTPSTGSNSP